MVKGVGLGLQVSYLEQARVARLRRVGVVCGQVGEHAEPGKGQG